MKIVLKAMVVSGAILGAAACASSEDDSQMDEVVIEQPAESKDAEQDEKAKEGAEAKVGEESGQKAAAESDGSVKEADSGQNAGSEEEAGKSSAADEAAEQSGGQEGAAEEKVEPQDIAPATGDAASPDSESAQGLEAGDQAEAIEPIEEPAEAQEPAAQGALPEAPQAVGSDSSAESTDGGLYTVVSGDTLGTIAAAQLGDIRRWREISELNQLANPNVIMVGQQLKLPAR